MPWKNGAGTTLQVAAAPDDAGIDSFDWRVSFATVCASGSFSRFPGVDRVITLASGDALTLSIDDHTHVLRAFEPLAFAGESNVYCEVPASGVTTDLNLMTRRGHARGEVTCRRLVRESAEFCSDKSPADVSMLAVLSGELSAVPARGAPVDMRPLDVVSDWSGALRLRGTGTIAEIRIWTRDLRTT